MAHRYTAMLGIFSLDGTISANLADKRLSEIEVLVVDSLREADQELSDLTELDPTQRPTYHGLTSAKGINKWPGLYLGDGVVVWISKDRFANTFAGSRLVQYPWQGGNLPSNLPQGLYVMLQVEARAADEQKLYAFTAALESVITNIDVSKRTNIQTSKL